MHDGTLAPGVPLPVSRYSGVQAITRTSDGSVWVSLNTPGLHRLQDGRWTHLRDLPGTREGASPLTLLPGADGRVWMGFAHNQIASMREAGCRSSDFRKASMWAT